MTRYHEHLFIQKNVLNTVCQRNHQILSRVIKVLFIRPCRVRPFLLATWRQPTAMLSTNDHFGSTQVTYQTTLYDHEEK